jgi:hypothetical protein
MLPVTHPRDYLPLLDRIGVALDATCGALMTLQSIDALSTNGDDKQVRGHVEQAIAHLRQAIDELRDANTQGQTGLALGFVLAHDRRTSSLDSGSDQSSPRRTA